MIIYKTLIRPIILYGAEAWTLSKDIFDRLRALERKSIRGSMELYTARIIGETIYSKDHWRNNIQQGSLEKQMQL
jgi:hypothetical protein